MDTSFTQNRELSRLDFNERVLEEANDENVKLFERLKFYSIFGSNLEEFFMVRVGSLTDLSNLKKKAVDNKSNMTPEEQLSAIMKRCVDLYKKKDLVYEKLVDDLKLEDVHIKKVSELDPKDRNFVEYYFDTKIDPILNFQVVEWVRPFPRLQNLSLNVIFSLKHEEKKLNKKTGKKEKIMKPYLGLIFVPDKINRYIKISNKTIVLIEDIIKEFGDKVFEKYQCDNRYIISLTRNADISYNDDDYEVDMDFRSYMKDMLRKRKRLHPVRLEIDGEPDPKLKALLMEKLMLKEENIFITTSPLRAGFFFKLIDEMGDDLKAKLMDPPFEPQVSSMVNPNKKMIGQIEKRDIFLSYPYESMDPIINLLNEAAVDDSVVSIKITLYRIAKDSEIAKALIKAAENGKEVFVLMELRARFDEDNNIVWSSRLEDAGCKIVYGFDNYKCHSKVLLITRIENEKISYITQVATGNYNEDTAKLYTDFSYLTSNIEIGMDAKDLFDNIMIGNLDGEYNHLLVSPKSMQEGLDKLIDEQILRQKQYGDGYIRLKMNSISDRLLIDKLSEASNKGVKIDMMVRGITCILPGIAGKTENIDIYQIVGRFLEHHRVYQFGKEKEAKIYISSADFMTRNIRNRMEVAVPIYNDEIRKKIMCFMDIMFSDDVKIRKLQADGTYTKVPNLSNSNAQEILIKNAIARAKDKEEKKKSHAISQTYQEEKLKDENKMIKEAEEKKVGFLAKLISIFAKKK
ncbi:MAG: polyphosphate kinase 1 [Peptoniphilaceae bacterium]|nr:polyphosphate kinase 1 [Peptoniphilaceae bacterium]MDY6018680.1 polyphosphate kinase 1 [Anaerococcus sp.]